MRFESAFLIKSVSNPNQTPSHGRFNVKKKLMIVLLLASITGWAGSAFAADLKVGDSAPAFTLKGSDGKTYKLEDYLGKKAVVLAWFPKAFTSG